MNTELYIICDYKKQFGSKWNAIPYRSGFDLESVSKCFLEYGIKVIVINFSEVQFLNDLKGKLFVYTSSEEERYVYKSYIEDVIHFLEISGALVIPEYKFLKANNNKVFMELLKKSYEKHYLGSLKSFVFGSISETEIFKDKLTYPLVLKTADGAMSTGVSLAKKESELLRQIENKSYKLSVFKIAKEAYRKWKYRGYKKEDSFKGKFVIQDFIPGLKSDYKILIFWDRYYIFERPVRKNDFRASGSGSSNYIYGSKVNLPKGILEYCETLFKSMEIPNLSIDIAYTGEAFFVIEFQAIYFGTVGVVKSDGFYQRNIEGNWAFIRIKLEIENIYVYSISNYLNNKF
jgi:glutathione synthase/RimK-type ligase-like ATP-grasp enzyme